MSNEMKQVNAGFRQKEKKKRGPGGWTRAEISLLYLLILMGILIHHIRPMCNLIMIILIVLPYKLLNYKLTCIYVHTWYLSDTHSSSDHRQADTFVGRFIYLIYTFIDRLLL
jgi:hypothetical protein